ncbi:transmembrane protein 209 [Tanacetum coccineum]
MKTPTGKVQYVSSPWRGSSSREISTEKQLETFLADSDEKFSMSAGKMATPPPTISGFGSPGTNTSGTTRSTPLRAGHMSTGKMATPPPTISGFGSPGTNTSGTTRSTPLRAGHMSTGKMATPPPTISGFGSPGTNTSGTTSTPLRAVRMSPGSQKFSTPPWKGEGYLPPPMTMEDSISVFERLGVYPQIEQWRDHPRQLGDYLRKTKKCKEVVVAQRANDQNRFVTGIVTAPPFVSVGSDPRGRGLKRKIGCTLTSQQLTNMIEVGSMSNINSFTENSTLMLPDTIPKDEYSCMVDVLALPISRVRISGPKRSRIYNPTNPVQQEHPSNITIKSLCKAF